MGPSGTGKTSALLIPTLRSWQGTALVVDISGDISANVHTENKIILTLRQRIVFRMMCLRPLMQPRMIPSVRSVWSSWPICFCRTRPTTARRGVFFTKNGRKMITAALICYYGMGWGFIEICEFFLGHDWRSLLNDIAKQENAAANHLSVPLPGPVSRTPQAASKVQMTRSNYLQPTAKLKCT